MVVVKVQQSVNLVVELEQVDWVEVGDFDVSCNDCEVSDVLELARFARFMLEVGQEK
jgi:hypothetical protein